MGFAVAVVTGVLLAVGGVAAVAQVASSTPDPASMSTGVGNGDIATYGDR